MPGCERCGVVRLIWALSPTRVSWHWGGVRLFPRTMVCRRLRPAHEQLVKDIALGMKSDTCRKGHVSPKMQPYPLHPDGSLKGICFAPVTRQGRTGSKDCTLKQTKQRCM